MTEFVAEVVDEGYKSEVIGELRYDLEVELVAALVVELINVDELDVEVPGMDIFEELDVDGFDKLDELDGLDELDELDKFDELDELDELDKLDELDELDELDKLDRLDELDEPDDLAVLVVDELDIDVRGIDELAVNEFEGVVKLDVDEFDVGELDEVTDSDVNDVITTEKLDVEEINGVAPSVDVLVKALEVL
ncbi:hypothetical protein BP5796_12940 [Coleophoma crateriformis]|uniref:Uncharacterized protein n=1 Tax=Coleophoma crateriformis TaxID=565419 RepID=A0A3D8Q4Y4_9HELO|nr:hypothetical protein BP5796_12940 [Coleophoma crateriformis]